MFERYLSDALTTYFGHLVENMDSDKVRLSAWSGQLSMEDLTLRRDALGHFVPNCPIEIAYGRVGRLELKVPWNLVRSQLKWRTAASEQSEKCSLVLSDIDIIVSPVRKREPREVEDDSSKGTIEEPETDTRTKARQRLDKEEEAQRQFDAALLEKVAQSSASSSHWKWVRDWIASWLSSLSVVVRNVHVRYEDPGVCSGFVWPLEYQAASVHRHSRPFAVGITLKQFSFKSASSLPAKTTTQKDSNDPSDLELPSTGSSENGTTRHSNMRIRHKSILTEEVALYWDHGCHLMISNCEAFTVTDPNLQPSQYFHEALSIMNGKEVADFPHPSFYNANHTYILDPVSPSVHMTLVSQLEEIKPSSSHAEDDAETDNKDDAPAGPLNDNVPSNFSIFLPPCQLTVTRNMLNDVTYIRKSLSNWKQANSGMLSESSLRRLASLRPGVTPLEDPRSWWIYLIEANLVLIRVSQGYEHRETKFGWLGLARALARRKRYIEQYKRLFNSDEGSKLDAHKALVELESELSPKEISCFRVAVFDALRADSEIYGEWRRNSKPKVKSSWQNWVPGMGGGGAEYTADEPDDESALFDNRLQMLDELMLVVQRDISNAEARRNEKLEALNASQLLDTSQESAIENFRVVVCTSTLHCREICIQVNDSTDSRSQQTPATSYGETNRIFPIVNFAFGYVQENEWFLDGSWSLESTMAGLSVKDLTRSAIRGLGSGIDKNAAFFPQLLSRKKSRREELLTIDGISRHRSLTVSIRRLFNTPDEIDPEDQLDGQSKTEVSVRILPMVFIYATVPVEALSRVLGTVKTADFTDDYHRVASVMSVWRERQKMRFLEALAHQRKVIVVDVDINAPEILIPEDLNRADSPMLSIDFGRLRITNGILSQDECHNFDDQWLLSLSDIQAQCKPVLEYIESQKGENGNLSDNSSPHVHQIIEPFSLNFSIATKMEQSEVDGLDSSAVSITATLPRLVFNLSSSITRLIIRLQDQWDNRKALASSTVTTGQNEIISSPQKAHQKQVDQRKPSTRTSNGIKIVKSSIQFQFSAPTIKCNLSNDVDGLVSKLSSLPHDICPIASLECSGIRGTIIREASRDGTIITNFSSKLHQLSIIDLYQSAGIGFSPLVSSVSTQMLFGQALYDDQTDWRKYLETMHHQSGDRFQTNSFEDLVAVHYRSRSGKKTSSAQNGTSLSIKFHELFVEWNPETIAAIQTTIRLPMHDEDQLEDEITIAEVPSFDNDDVFFDAVEETFHDVQSVNAAQEEPSYDGGSWDGADTETIQTLSLPAFDGEFIWNPKILNFTRVSAPRVAFEEKEPDDKDHPSSFEFTFDLMKLRVSFNKDARHRRLFIAQMDTARIKYSSKLNGGSVTSLSLGNLVFIDSSSLENGTLYAEILGLQSDTGIFQHGVGSSLLEMTICLNNQHRSFCSPIVENDAIDASSPVTVDKKNGKMIGSNCFISATFSPMRFVILEQLWMEIIDYFFEGIMGAKVWGSQGDKDESIPNDPAFNEMRSVNYGNQLQGADAEGVYFTRFDIKIDSPMILLPVTYRSPQFIRLQLESVSVTNHFNSKSIGEKCQRVQWYNNCLVRMEGLQIFTWSGTRMDENAALACISVVWPVGPKASSIFPKWDVECRIDDLDIVLRKSDYGLVQNIISFNIGEESRHLEEWQALQELSKSVAETLASRIAVHFGYDTKNVAPSTFDFTVSIPQAFLRLVSDAKDNTELVATIECTGLSWNLLKLSDRISRQTLTCQVAIRSNDEGVSCLLLSSRDLIYTSVSEPNGNNARVLDIRDPTIYGLIQPWKTFRRFFDDLSTPLLFSVEDIGSSIQIGDRWYRISSDKGPTKQETHKALQFDWIPISETNSHLIIPEQRATHMGSENIYQFRILLLSPKIIFSSLPTESSEINSLTLRLGHLDYLSTSRIKSSEKSLFVHDLEVYASKGDASSRSSLIKPWCVAIRTTEEAKTKVGDDESIESTTCTYLSADTLEAHASYSDIMVAVEVCLSSLYASRSKSETGLDPSSTAGDRTPNTVSYETLPETEQISHSPCLETKKVCMDGEWDGFSLLLVDDSGRHFASSQELLLLSLGRMAFTQYQTFQQIGTGPPTNRMSSTSGKLGHLEVYDCLQSKASPFRLVATSRIGDLCLRASGNLSNGSDHASPFASNQRKMTWENFSMLKCVDESIFCSASQVFTNRTTLAGLNALQASWRERSSPNRDLSLLSDSISPAVLLNYLNFKDKEKTQHKAKMKSLALQWNPSTVIAVQRFLGRLRKDSMQRAEDVLGDDAIHTVENLLSNEDNITVEDNTKVSHNPIEVAAEVESIVVCLNKEHQKRRLLEATLSNFMVDLQLSNSGIDVDGRLGNYHVWDSDVYENNSIEHSNRTILEVMNGQREVQADIPTQIPFLRVQYRTFSGQSHSDRYHSSPAWIRRTGQNRIDDYLIVSVAAPRFVLLRERTEEILDYLSNGLPGRGMGATSRAAKGFLSKRIVTNSFLQISINSPQIIIPQHEGTETSLELHLGKKKFLCYTYFAAERRLILCPSAGNEKGDVSIKSWFEEVLEKADFRSQSGLEQRETNEWWRILSLNLIGFSFGVSECSDDKSIAFESAADSIDLGISLRKPTIKGKAISVKGSLTFVETHLKYSDYSLLHAMIRDNLGRDIDTERWDNVEKAYWMENSGVENIPGDDAVEYPVAYAENARFVRYGTRKKDNIAPLESSDAMESDSSSTALELSFRLDGLALTLHRDDPIRGERTRPTLCYDIALLRVKVVEISVTTTRGGDVSLHLSLFRIGLFDLGDSGRLLRENHRNVLQGNHHQARPPCPFVVLAEGYSPTDDPSNSKKSHIEHDPQLVITIDRCRASSALGVLSDCELPPGSNVTVARVVINYLSVNALVRPFSEIVSFLSRSWCPPGKVQEAIAPVVRNETENIELEATQSIPSSRDAFQLKLVAHYPRLFFVADENDIHSRALVLRGLAVVNLSKTVAIVEQGEAQESESKKSLIDQSLKYMTALDAQLHSLESYINPDVLDILGLKSHHAEMVEDRIPDAYYSDRTKEETLESTAANALGIALIQPVTTGIEYSEVRRNLFPSERSIFVNVEPVSTMLGFEDLQLIESVLRRWSTRRAEKSLTKSTDLAGPPDPDQERVSRAHLYNVTFSEHLIGLGLRIADGEVIVESFENADRQDEIKTGDSIVSVAGVATKGRSLVEVVKQFSESARPITVSFSRAKPKETGSDSSIKSESYGGTVVSSDSSQSLLQRRGSYFERIKNIAETHIDTFSVKLFAGRPNGLQLRGKSSGICPVVVDVSSEYESAFAHGEALPKGSFRVPQAGARVISVNGVLAESIGFKDTLHMIEKLAAGKEDYDPDDDIHEETYEIHFSEVNSHLWGTVERIDVSIADITLSFIDDINGRDMPLLRGNVGSAEVHVERGLDTIASNLDSSIPIAIKLCGHKAFPLDDIAVSNVSIVDIEADVTTTFSAIAACRVDYYHPKTAVWEPLLESSQLFFLAEFQPGNKVLGRPAQTAVEISDRLLRSQQFRQNMARKLWESRRMVTFNLTDAASKVFVRFLDRWQQWRRSIANEDTADGDVSQKQSHFDNSDSASVYSLSDRMDMEEGGDSTLSAISGNRPATPESASRYLASQQTTLAALTFAQRRGADSSQKQDSAKPFIIRNRTGVSIAFASQGNYRITNPSSSSRPTRQTSLVGEYIGLEGYDDQHITELADQDDAKFSMDVMSSAQTYQGESTNSGKSSMNRVRTYEGRYPHLSVALQAVAGVLIEPLENLQVSKVGDTIRVLRVRQTEGQESESEQTSSYSIPVVWRVEIEDNRRILTLSSAAEIVSIGHGMPVEVGVSTACTEERPGQPKSRIQSIGVTESGRPFHLPLWISLNEETEVFIRPFSKSFKFSWGAEAILKFSFSLPGNHIVLDPMGGHASRKEREIMYFCKEIFTDSTSIRCDPISANVSPAWLSCFSQSTAQLLRDKNQPRSASLNTMHHVKSIAVDSEVTIRNMLPMDLQWEVSHSKPAHSHKEEGFQTRGILETKPHLKCGAVVEAIGCSIQAVSIEARFQGPNSSEWSTWASLRPPSLQQMQGKDARQKIDFDVMKMTAARQVNVRLPDKIPGSSLTLGVRILPKTTSSSPSDFSSLCVYGVEVIVYCELWIRNLTNLPLNFGCPSYQMHDTHRGQDKKENTSDEGAIRFVAESALMDIASVLEFGDKGTDIHNKAAQGIAAIGSILSLPDQACTLLVEEVFEYVEMSRDSVKRRWWASESYDNYREDIVHSAYNDGSWNWIDDAWTVDCAGQVDNFSGGWESCRHLLGGSNSFSEKREFDASHTFRRRRWFRRRDNDGIRRRFDPINSNGVSELSNKRYGDIQVFHQPLIDSFTREKKKILKGERRKRGSTKFDRSDKDDVPIKVSMKNGDGAWSRPITLPPAGTYYGVVEVPSSRWPALATSKSTSAIAKGISIPRSDLRFGMACLNPGLVELCCQVADAEGDWGEFSRLMTVSPRFLVRNDSLLYKMEVKQSGSPDKTRMILLPGEAKPFYWADHRLPKLVSIRPATHKSPVRPYKWSGGFDICSLGMLPVRVQESQISEKSHLRSIRTHVEIRPGTGGSGINVSFKEEDASGTGSLFRIENRSTMTVWFSQDGTLANPPASLGGLASTEERSPSQTRFSATDSYHRSHHDEDFVCPSDKTAYALRIPYRQGKYSHRKAASFSELMRLRVALAPLTSRAGIESVKVVNLSQVGDTVRLYPSRLTTILPESLRKKLQNLCIFGIVATDGPTRVLKLNLIEDQQYEMIFGNPFGDVAYMSTRSSVPGMAQSFSSGTEFNEIVAACNTTAKAAKTGKILSEDDAKQQAFFPSRDNKVPKSELVGNDVLANDTVFSFRAAFSGFLISLVDASPSEIATATLNNVNALARWNSLRTTDASSIISVGSLQCDNHVPSSPFPVALRPERQAPENPDEQKAGNHRPLLVIGLSFTPKHESGIVCLRSVTIAPRNLVIAVDLAFLVRLQRFYVGIFAHQDQSGPNNPQGTAASGFSEQRRPVLFPVFEDHETTIKKAAEFGVGNQKIYFEGLTILPCNIQLSVAPARALTESQANLEGKEAASIHEAVRKGDILVGNSSTLLNVRVGRKNTTPLSVVRGVFKSIVVDALLRLDDASLNFSGVFLRNHITTVPQLTTFLLAHYLDSFRQNVPALLGSLAAFGNPLGLIRGLGDGVSDFVIEPVKGLKKSVKELDPFFLVDGVAKGTESLARHTVGGFADSASLLTETFSKNMAVLTLDRRYAHKRDQNKFLRDRGQQRVTLAGGMESGAVKLVQGFVEGVTGVVRAPIRGAEKRGIEGFAKGVGKGLLGLLVKPIIGISDAATDVMIGVKSTVDGDNIRNAQGLHRNQFRPRRPLYGPDKVIRPYDMAAAAASALMLRTRIAGENYLSHVDMSDRVALLSVKRFLLLDSTTGRELLLLRYKHIARIETRVVSQKDGSEGWSVIIALNTPRRNGSEVEVICCKIRSEAEELCNHIRHGMDVAASG